MSSRYFVILRCNWIPEQTVHDPCDNTTEYFLPEKRSSALPGGITLIDNGMNDKQDDFLYTHEMAHCLNLMHHEVYGCNGNSITPKDHDNNDHNCTMCYPDAITSRKNLEWNKGDKETPVFCGKCLLKLRGWRVTPDLLPPES